jgi:hypothetical protein
MCVRPEQRASSGRCQGHRRLLVGNVPTEAVGKSLRVFRLCKAEYDEGKAPVAEFVDRLEQVRRLRCAHLVPLLPRAKSKTTPNVNAFTYTAGLHQH